MSVKDQQASADKLLVSWQSEFWQLLAERDQAQAAESDAWDQGDLPAVSLARHRRLQVELALEKLRSKGKKRS